MRKFSFLVICPDADLQQRTERAVGRAFGDSHFFTFSSWSEAAVALDKLRIDAIIADIDESDVTISQLMKYRKQSRLIGFTNTPYRDASQEQLKFITLVAKELIRKDLPRILKHYRKLAENGLSAEELNMPKNQPALA